MLTFHTSHSRNHKKKVCIIRSIPPDNGILRYTGLFSLLPVFLSLMFSRALPNLAKNIAKLRRKVINKPWAGKSAPTSALRVFMSKFFKGKKGFSDLAGAHAAFKKLSPAQVQSYSKIAAENMKRKHSLKAQVQSAKCHPYSLFVQRNMPAIYNAEKKNCKDRKVLFRVAVKKVSAKYQKLSAAQRKALSVEAAQFRKKGNALIEKLVEQRK